MAARSDPGRGEPGRDDEGRTVAMMATFHDLTTCVARNTKNACCAPSTRPSSNSRHAGAGARRAGRIVRFNRACELASGRSRGEVLGRYPGRAVAPEQAETVRREAFDTRPRTRRPWAAATPTSGWPPTARGLDRMVQHAAARRDGRMTNMVCVGVDITQRQRAQAAVAHSEQRLNEAQRIAQVGSWERDHLGGQLAWSDEVFRMFEIDPACHTATTNCSAAASIPTIARRSPPPSGSRWSIARPTRSNTAC